MPDAPIFLELSMDQQAFLNYDSHSFTIILDIGEEVSEVDAAIIDGADLSFEADSVPYVYELPDEIIYVLDKDEAFLQIKNYTVDELFNEISGPVTRIERE